jgi:single-stranded DNA-binding protein
MTTTSTIIGRVTRAPQGSRRRAADTRTFTVAVERRQRDKKQHWPSQINEVTVICRGAQAEAVTGRVHRGDHVACVGVFEWRPPGVPRFAGRAERLVNVSEVTVIPPTEGETNG